VSSRGFTLMELMVVVSISSIVVAAVAAFHLEGRVAIARAEMQVNLQRQASLAAEWIGREIREAGKIEAHDGELILIDGDRRVRFGVDGGKLFREEGSERFIVTKNVVEFHAEQIISGWSVDLALERPLLAGRSVRIERRFWVGRRR
jgi:prepilin-type N-terminal cleavage/methylation domain-containing protein